MTKVVPNKENDFSKFGINASERRTSHDNNNKGERAKKKK